MMRFILFVLLFLSFAYALGLVLVNSTDIAVNLIFSQAPAMNLGLLLIICLTLGIVIGILIALLLFRVLQNKWEIARLQKLNKNLQAQVEQAHIVIDRQANSPTVEEAIMGATTVPIRQLDEDVTLQDKTTESAILTKRKR